MTKKRPNPNMPIGSRDIYKKLTVTLCPRIREMVDREVMRRKREGLPDAAFSSVVREALVEKLWDREENHDV